FKAAFYRFLGQQVINSKMLAYIAQKIDQPGGNQPISVIDEHSRIGLRLKIQKTTELRFDALKVVLDLLFRQQLALLRFAAWIANHACSAAYKRDRRMTMLLKSHEAHNWKQMTDVQACGSRIKAIIACNTLASQYLFQPLRSIINHLSPQKLFINVHTCSSPIHNVCILIFLSHRACSIDEAFRVDLASSLN